MRHRSQIQFGHMEMLDSSSNTVILGVVRLFAARLRLILILTIIATIPSFLLPLLRSGGNGHALSHFQASNGLYPLCVKLGTISASGGDVYSYAPDEDDMVTDPHLARHLAHWGINVMSLAKTDKSMAELNIDLNASYDFSRICEAGKDLVAVSGPGLIGCENLGNSCYMASVLQAVAALPMTSSLFVGPGGAVARSLYASSGAVPADDLLVQMAKVMAGLTSDKYASPLTSAPQVVMAQAPPAVTEEEATAASNAVALSMTGTSSADAANLTHTTADDAAAVAAGGKGGAAPEVPPGPGSACGFIVPRAFKTLIGKGHPEFSSGRQQDAIQFFEYLLAQLDKVHHKDGKRVNDALTAAAGAGGAAAGSVTNLSQLFSYNVETRLQDLTSSDGNTYVRYTSSQERFWRLPIPMEAAVPIAADTSVTSGGGDVDMSGGSANKRARGETGSPIPTTGAASCSSSSAVPVAPGGAPTQRVPFSACVQSWAAPAHITDWQSPVTGIRGTAAATSRFASFPSVLVIQLGRYTTAPDWTTVKIDASVPMPLSLTLDAEGGVASTAADVSSAGDVTAASSIPSFSIDLRAKGRQAGEAEFPSAAAPAAGSSAAPAAAAAPPQPDPVLVAELESMGFSSGAASRSALATAGAGLEAAMEYLLAHMEDEGFNDPYVPQAAAAAAAPATAAASSAASSVDPAAVSMLCDMGFDPERASYALSTTSGNLERAADWLFAHADEPLPSASAASSGGSGAAMEVEAPSSAAGAAAAAVTGRGVYELTGVISHMGRSTGSGHYVAHLRKGGNGTWYLFNDAKVAVSQDPPLDVGYLYVYTRKE